MNDTHDDVIERCEDNSGLLPTLDPRRRRKRQFLRVTAAMWRLSRDRWLSPEEVIEIGNRLSWCCSPGCPWSTFGAAVDIRCNYLGMLRGRPPFDLSDHGYMGFLAALKKRKRWKVSPELMILQLHLGDRK